ncbi:MAG: glycosyltransferase family 4 protein, partial [Patescibacteria group bacterium]|nr:glycosyltransferase family 4 protein [Patescibacteria group bacterium]
NLVIGLSGIDEVILGKKVYKTKMDWEKNRIIIEKEVQKWFKFSNAISFIHVPSESDKKQMIEYLKIPEEKIHVIYHGVDHEKYKPSQNKELARKRILGRFFMVDSPYFIHVGESNWARKNVFRMLEAYEKARESGIIQKLILVGRSDPIVYEKARSIEGIIVLGFVSEDDLANLLQGADALIFPSLHEGFGLPLVEAMACGIPVITSNVFSPPEIADGAGLFLDPYNTKNMTTELIEISRNDSLRNDLGKKAIERAKKFSWKYSVHTLFDLIRENTNYNSSSFDFNQSYDVAACRTLTTVCQIMPDLYNIAIRDLLKFDYSRIIQWALEVGLDKPEVADFLNPFKDWLISHS